MDNCRSSAIHLISGGKSHNYVVFTVQPIWIQDYLPLNKSIHHSSYSIYCTNLPKFYDANAVGITINGK